MREAAGGPRPLVACLLHLGLTAVLFGDVVFAGRVPYFRDVGTYYYPDYVFAADSLRQGVWPLWNHTADAGAPYLKTYPVELVLLLAAGARGTLTLGPLLHVFAAMCGATWLARTLGVGRGGAWLAGAVFGLSGFLQSTLNLVPLSHGAALAPFVIAAYLRCVRRPDGRRAGELALLAALQLSTFAADIVLQTALVGLVLTPERPRLRHLRALLAAGIVATLLAAPALVGLHQLTQGTARAAGFSARTVLSWSAHPAVLAEALWPRFLGDPHTMTDLGYVGQPFFPDGYPYLVSLYVGPLVLGLALCGAPSRRRLAALAVLGVLLALGAHGPFSGILPVLMPNLRAPVKFLFVSTLAVAVLAGRGLERATGDEGRRSAWWIAIPCGAMLAAGAVLALWPVAVSGAAAAVWSHLGAATSLPVVRTTWPQSLLATGALGAAAAAALVLRRPRLAFLPAACVVADLLLTNASVDASAPPDFYRLRPAMAELVGKAGAEPARWYSYGVANSPGLHWAPGILARNQDVWLYYMDRQTLFARSMVVDGREGAFDEDRTGWAPPGSTLDAASSRPGAYRTVHERLRRAGVRYVLSFAPLPEDLVAPLGQARLPEIAEPVRLYTPLRPLPRAYWVPDCQVAATAADLRARLADPTFDPAARVILREAPPASGLACGTARGEAHGTVGFRRLDPHRVRLEVAGDAGFVVVLEGHHPAWRAEGAGPLQVANDRYWAIPTGGGARTIDVVFRPRWSPYALSALALGVLFALILLAGRGLRLTQAPASC